MINHNKARYIIQTITTIIGPPIFINPGPYIKKTIIKIIANTETIHFIAKLVKISMGYVKYPIRKIITRTAKMPVTDMVIPLKRAPSIIFHLNYIFCCYVVKLITMLRNILFSIFSMGKCLFNWCCYVAKTLFWGISQPVTHGGAL